ncbi:27103_t:CDS:2 [Gigaspora margarita]|uniref:27103_t:CDS:1 n=1 Tax=Gigaspora margarita TaxID=4874 RepID=A0ABN7UZF8_GIGMA|nr:27103_t:CDS:2 [Gigaspora margarita]
MSNIDLFEKIEFGQKFEYASFEDKEEIGKGRFGVMCKAYLKDIKQIVALKTLYFYDENSLGDMLKKVCISFVTTPYRAFGNRVTRMSMHLIRGKRENPIEGTPVDFKTLYDDSWGRDPKSRPDIREIREKLNNIRLEQALYYILLKFLKKCSQL